MAITVDNLIFYKSERMTDLDDGGGQMTATPIQPGIENQIFDDISDVDRAAGDVSIRKVYAAVTSEDAAKYLDAGVIIFKPPIDPATTVLAFSSGNFYDQHADLQNIIEQAISRGGRWDGYLWGMHSIGQRAIILWQATGSERPTIGDRLELATNSTSDFVWVTAINQVARTITDDKGNYTINEVTLEIAEGLKYDYTGSEPTRTTPTNNLSTTIYSTRYNANSVPLHGIMPLNTLCNNGDRAVYVDNLYTPIIPTSFTETAIADSTPGAGLNVLVQGNDNTINFTTNTECVKPSAALWLGTVCYPGSLSIVGGGSTFNDNAGDILVGSTVVGSIDYSNGVAQFNDSCPNLSTQNKLITFKPASVPTRVANTLSIAVTAENQGYVWAVTLVPIPCPNSLTISYLVNAKWYTISDKGAGALSGADSSYGSAMLNFTTGTSTLTTGAKPDVGSDIIFSWGIPINSRPHGGEAIAPPKVTGTTEHVGIAPSTVTVTWATYSLTDTVTLGILAGNGGHGEVNYATGEWWVIPDILPNLNTEFTINYSYGDQEHETFSSGGNITLSNQNILPGSVMMYWTNAFETGSILKPNTHTRLVSSIDLGNGIFKDNNSTINYINGIIAFDGAAPITLAEVNKQGIYIYFYTFETLPRSGRLATGSSIEIYYRFTGSNTSATETVTLSTLALDLTPGYAETIVSGSTRFTIGNDLYCDFTGKIYRNPSFTTGDGTLSGTLDPTSGRVLIYGWTPGVTNVVTLQSLTTNINTQPVSFVTFRTPLVPIKSGTLQLRATTENGDTINKTVDGTGILIDNDCTININYQTGVVKVKFGLYKTDAQCIADNETLEWWYNQNSFVDIGGVQKIWRPLFVLADSIIYNAVANTFLPPNSDLLGLNAARLPPDGKALAFDAGRLALVHNTQTITQPTLSANQVIDCGRTRLYRVTFADANNSILSSDKYTLDRVAGNITLADPLDQTGFTPPWTISHTVADLVRIADIDISGKIVVNKALSHTYPAYTSYISSVLYFGTLQAGISHVFSQSTWTGVWQDTVIGSSPLAQYSNALYPIAVTNAGAYSDKILIQFTSSTNFNVIGKNLGFIGIGNINTNCSPINSLTSEAYFTIDHRGWGSGWLTGNCLRFNATGACYPVDLIRAIQPSEPTTSADTVELLLIGNVDA